MVLLSRIEESFLRNENTPSAVRKHRLPHLSTGHDCLSFAVVRQESSSAQNEFMAKVGSFLSALSEKVETLVHPQVCRQAQQNILQTREEMNEACQESRMLNSSCP
uniref:Uncharacterized protein n=1 Tax=Grammatophora oceanica TaxID=210454 RepID=A0A7S1V0Y2_9STRA|mmetsp:Transcript_33175/g.49141  ORF Transcript_33175/g.49141 Transcript_33175/m.49141 type:complete len:106 (+) Transcript_33175:211-528(+)